MSIRLINFIDLNLEEKKMILEWRNQPEIKAFMYNQDEITLEEHLNFIETLKTKEEKLYFLVKKENEYIGVIDFTQIIKKESLHMGIYGNPNKKGNGKILLNEIIKYSFSILEVKKIFSEVFKENNKAYELYKKFGFKDISEKIINEKKVICMELENNDYKESLCVK